MNASYSIVVCRRNENGLYVQAGLLVGHSRSVESLAFNNATGYLASCGEDGIMIWNVETFQLVHHLAFVLISSILALESHQYRLLQKIR